MVFRTKTVALAFFRDMLGRYADGDRIADEDAASLNEILQLHHESEQKIGCGVDHFEVRVHRPFKTKGFYIVRTDGSGTDFSYLTCINGRSVKQDVTRAFRTVIRPDIAELKSRAFDGCSTIVCELSGKHIASDEAHVDHLHPHTFDAIVAGFLAERNLTFSAVPLANSADNQIVVGLADDRLAKDFRAYHNARATLRIISDKENMRLGKRAWACSRCCDALPTEVAAEEPR